MLRRQSRRRSVLSAILLALLVAVLAAGIVALWTARRSFPEVDGTAELPALDAPAEVIRDSSGIPHIYAETEHDLYAAQGYVHAQDRFFQMDFWRHIGAGRLSEMFGESQLETDIFLRSLGWTRLAEEELELLRPDTVAALEAYAEGVNAYLEERSGSELSLEYAVLGLTNSSYSPEPWNPVHSLTWAKVMAWDLCGNLSDEIARATLLNHLPREHVDDLYPPYSSDRPAIVPTYPPAGETREESASAPVTQALLGPAGRVSERLGRMMTEIPGPFAGSAAEEAGIGSNNWVVSGDLTASGAPLLANDTHLAAQMPSIWYEAGLHLTGNAADSSDDPHEVVGFTFPGMPGVVIGHNSDIAWGVTNTGTDVQDLYIEKLDPEDPTRYLTEDGWKQMEIRQETIGVAGADPVEITVRSTRHGPIISGAYEPLDEVGTPETLAEFPEPYALSLRWTALEPMRTMDAALLLNRARNVEEFREALRYWDAPAQNFVYADVAGNIAYQMPGKTPIRPHHDGRYPVPGWTGEYEWTGFAPFESLPHEANPERGYIVTANNSVTPDGRITAAVPEYQSGSSEAAVDTVVTADPHYGYRAARIVEMLENRAGGVDAASFQEIHSDGRNLNAENLIPYVSAAVRADGGELGHAVTLLREWDRQQAADSAAAALFETFWAELLDATFGDELAEAPDRLLPHGGSRWFQVVDNLLETPDGHWWDDAGTGAKETRDDILRRALTDAVDRLGEHLGDDPQEWEWGDIHTVSFENQTLGRSGISIVEWLFNRGPYPVSGSTSVVNATSWDTRELAPGSDSVSRDGTDSDGRTGPPGAPVVALPSMRMIVDLEDLSASRSGHTTGQSGHAFHDNYEDMIDMWREVGYQPMLWEREDVERVAKGILRLVERAP